MSRVAKNALLPLALLGAAFALANPASADLFTPEPANAPPGSGASSGQQAAYCNSTCSSLVNTKGQILGLNETVGWSVADDLWCANHGSQTNPLVGPAPIPNAAAPPVGSCPVTLLPGDTNCNQTVSELAHCNWHNGQLEQQCEAYESAQTANGAEKVVLALDIAATATCTTACMTTAATVSTMQAACTDVGLVTSATELIETLSMQSSAMAKAVSVAMGGAGLFMDLKPVLEGSTNGGQTASQAFLGQGDKTPNGMGGNVADGSGKHKLGNQACKSAILFAAMTGMRYYDMNSQNSTKQDACSEVEQLASAAPTIGNGGIPIPTNLGGGGGSTGVASGGGTGATNTADSSLRCVGSGGTVSSCTGISSSSSPDIAALDSSGLGQQLAPQAAQIANSPLSEGSAGNAAGGAASGAGAPGDIAGALSTVASLAEEHSQALFDKGGEMAGNGGGGGGDSGDAQPNPMAMLAGLLGQKNGRSPSGSGTQNFQGAPVSHDIYHTNSPDNLFQIVSGQIQKHASDLSQ